MASSKALERNKKILIMFAFLLVFVKCNKEIFMPYMEARYIYESSLEIWGTSMNPTLKISDKFICNKLKYKWSDPQAGDIIIFKIPPDANIPEDLPEKERYYVCKRIVAVGGENVQVINNNIYINDLKREFKVSEEKTTTPPATSLDLAENSKIFLVPENKYFVLGDNLYNSQDSRDFGFISKGEIIGKVVKIYWPPERISKLYH